MTTVFVAVLSFVPVFRVDFAKCSSLGPDTVDVSMLHRARENSLASATSRMHLDHHPLPTSLASIIMPHSFCLSLVTRGADDDEAMESPLKDFCEEVRPLPLQFVANLKFFSFFFARISVTQSSRLS